jgi:hypothetical protein
MAKKKRRRSSAVPQRRPAQPAPKPPVVGESRLAPLRRRAARVKLGLVTTAIVVFGVGIAATRASFAGHSKRPLRPLAAPPGFVKIVRQNLLEAGIIAPAQAPPGAGTSVS